MRKHLTIALSVLFLAAAAHGQPQAYLVADLNQTTAPSGSHPNDFLTIGSISVFTTNDSSDTPLEVWRSDGSPAGTYSLGTGGRQLALWNGRAWFLAPDGALYSTDGTQAAVAAPLPLGLTASALIPSGPWLYFIGQNELWRTDGTLAGTSKIPNVLTPFPYDDYVGAGRAGQSAIFMSANYSPYGVTSRVFWRADSEVEQFFSLPADRVPARFINAGPLMYFEVIHYTNTASIIELWRTDGTAAGTFALKSGIHWNPVYGAPYAYYVAEGKMWRTDGSQGGAVALPLTLPQQTYFSAEPFGTLANGTLILGGLPVAPPQDRSYEGIYAFDGTNTTFLFNIARGNPLIGKGFGNQFLVGGDGELWRTDGTVGGSFKLLDVSAGNDGYWPMGAAGSLILFAAADPVYGWEPHKTDGTVQGTGIVEDIVVATYSSMPKALYPLNGGVLLTARSSGGSASGAPRDLWFSDGTAAGTKKLLEDVLVDSYLLTTCGGRGYFAHETDAAGFELWSTNGTPLGTAMLKDLDPRVTGGSPESSSPSRFACVDDRVLFFARNADGLGLWRSDGTAAGTLQVAVFPPGTEIGQAPARFGQGVFFGVRVNYESQLWLSDGTPNGTRSVKPVGDFLSPIIVAGYNAYFLTTPHGQLWRTNGTAAGTTHLSIAGSALNLFGFGDRVAFQQWNGANGLCSSEGQTVSCFDSPGNISSSGFSMRPMNGRLYYNAPDLRSTDGVTSVATGASMVSRMLAVAGGRLYFVRDSADRPLLETDATYAGTRSILDDRAFEAAASGGRLFIASQELYAYDLPVTPTSLSPRTVPATTGGQVVINGRGFAGPVSVHVEKTPVSVVSVTPTAITFTAPPRQPGTYEVKVINGDGREMTTDERLAYACTPLTATTGGNPPAVCPFTPVQLQGGGGSRCTWFPSTGLDNAASCTPVATVGTTTTYTLIVSDATACASTNHPTVTVTVTPKPSAQITFAPPGGGPYLVGGTYSASVADAGPGATYAWTLTGAQVSGATNQRTLTFVTRCETPQLSVVVTSAAGCASSTSASLYLSHQLSVTNVTPRLANAGATLTVTGTGFDCVTSVNLWDRLRWKDRPATPTVLSPTSLTFRMPANAPASALVGVISPFNESYESTGIYRPLRDDLMGRDMTTDLLLRNADSGLTEAWGIRRDGTLGYPSSARRAAGSSDYTVAAVYEFGWFLPEADILWQRTSTREFVLQLTGRSGEIILPRVPAADLTLATVADPDGNGWPELLMRNTTTGATEIWTLATNWTGITVQPLHGGGNLQWKIIGSRDFDGDGKHDILWRDANSGMTLIWFMNGASIRASQIVHQGGNTTWTIAALGDFDGDGKCDLLWRHTPTGATLLWKMNGASITSSTSVHPGGNLGWSILAAGDFNADSKADVLWRENTQGTILRWEMNGHQITKSAIYFQALDPAVKIESPRM